MKSSMLLLSVLVVSTGCAGASMTRLGAKSYPPKPPTHDVQLFTQPPQDRKFEELCLINARGGQSVFESKSVEALIPELKDKARACGADAIILKNTKEGGYNVGGPADRAEASATAIRFLDAPPAAPAPSQPSGETSESPAAP